MIKIEQTKFNSIESLALSLYHYRMTYKSLLPAVFVAMFALASCNQKENQILRAENDSLRGELVSRNDMVAVMKDVKFLIDSIDLSRKLLRADLGDGMSYDNFTTRLRDINSYVKNTQDRLTKVEKQLGKSDRNANAYLMMVDALKSELSIRIQEVASLESAVAEFKKENQGLMSQVKLQQTEMAEMQSKIEEKQQELAILDAKVKEMVGTFKMTEADAYFARAQAVEEAANRTKLAPRKKKETYRESLELYKKALSLGKKEARARITKLEAKVK
jgi:chromosome segregation ATPase